MLDEYLTLLQAQSNFPAWKQLGLVFIFGFLTSLTPCVYPLIPVTLSIFGAREAKSRRQAFLLSLMYVLGICVTYTTLGVISALTGAVFGQFLGNPIVILAIVAILVLLALSLLDLIPFNLGNSLQKYANNIGGAGFIGAFFMGSVSGIIAAPCTGPVLAAILLIAASTGKIVWSATLLFTYSLGLGVIFILLGTFSELLTRLPKSGGWLYGIKFLMACLILMVAFFFASPLLSDIIPPLSSTFVSVISVLACLIAFYTPVYKNLVRFIAALLVAFCINALFVSPTATALYWENSLQANPERKTTLTMVDLFADWCAACKEFDHITFADSKVQSHLANLRLVRIDFTTASDESDKITEQYKIQGLPTILFLDSSGNEIPDSRITGFLNPEDFLKHLSKIHVTQ